MGKSDMMVSFHGNNRYSLLISRSVYNNPFTSIHIQDTDTEFISRKLHCFNYLLKQHKGKV